MTDDIFGKAQSLIDQLAEKNRQGAANSPRASSSPPPNGPAAEAPRARPNEASRERVQINGHDDEHVEVVLIRGDEVTPREVSWLWENWCARGKLNITAGRPETLKTTIEISKMATPTT